MRGLLRRGRGWTRLAGGGLGLAAIALLAMASVSAGRARPWASKPARRPMEVVLLPGRAPFLRPAVDPRNAVPTPPPATPEECMGIPFIEPTRAYYKGRRDWTWEPIEDNELVPLPGPEAAVVPEQKAAIDMIADLLVTSNAMGSGRRQHFQDLLDRLDIKMLGWHITFESSEPVQDGLGTWIVRFGLRPRIATRAGARGVVDVPAYIESYAVTGRRFRDMRVPHRPHPIFSPPDPAPTPPPREKVAGVTRGTSRS